MRVYAILAHDKNDSLNGFIFQKITDHLKKQNVELDVVSLYDYANDIPFFNHEKEILEKNSFFLKNKESILAADRMIIVHPIYWYSTPGILKCWIDLITNFAYKYKSGAYAQPLHKIKTSLTVNTSMAPLFYRKYLSCNTATRQIRETMKFIGIKTNYFYEIGSVYKLNNRKVELHINKILCKTEKLLKD